MNSYEEFKIGNLIYFSRDSGPWKLRLGYVIASRNKYYAYNSFKCYPYLSKLDHSEIFQSEDSAKKWMTKYNISGEIVSLVCREHPSTIFRF